MPYRLGKDLISQVELRKGAEFIIGTSAAVRLVRELYLDALERRIARGALIESGPFGFAQSVGVVPEKKEAGRETQVVGASRSRGRAEHVIDIPVQRRVAAQAKTSAEPAMPTAGDRAATGPLMLDCPDAVPQ
jgi:hypothetical protein